MVIFCSPLIGVSYFGIVLYKSDFVTLSTYTNYITSVFKKPSSKQTGTAIPAVPVFVAL